RLGRLEDPRPPEPDLAAVVAPDEEPPPGLRRHLDPRLEERDLVLDVALKDAARELEPPPASARDLRPFARQGLELFLSAREREPRSRIALPRDRTEDAHLAHVARAPRILLAHGRRQAAPHAIRRVLDREVARVGEPRREGLLAAHVALLVVGIGRVE